jgi:ankyrin repeat protein
LEGRWTIPKDPADRHQGLAIGGPPCEHMGSGKKGRKGMGQGNAEDGRLLRAAGRGDVELISELLDAGASIHARDRDGRCCLSWAAESSVEAMALLLSKGADMASVDNSGGSPLHYAATLDNAETARFLLDAGADAAAVDFGGHTPLHEASVPEIVSALLNAGADPGGRTRRGELPIHAILGRDAPLEAVEMLSEFCLVPHPNGKTCRELAEGRGRQDLAALFGSIEIARDEASILEADTAPLAVPSASGRRI